MKMHERMGVLLVNLGTPNSLSFKDVKRYLNQFLTDRRVIDLPWPLRQLLVRGVIVKRRCKESVKLYQSIWTEKGSPLKIYGNQLAEKLQESLGESFQVELAMRYQKPSIREKLEKIKGIQNLMIIPLFPQYASATTGSIYQEIFEILQRWEIIPSLVSVNEFATHPYVIRAFCAVARQRPLSDYDHFVFSYHGLPERYVRKADRFNHCLKTSDCCRDLKKINHSCYAAQCVGTTKGICKELGLQKERTSHCYQSKLGKAPWLKPYTIHVIEELAKKGAKKILVFCPAFVADCLETLQEIGIEYRNEFKKMGGEELDLVDGLNATSDWVDALKRIILERSP